MTDPGPIWHETSRFRAARDGRPERLFERCVHPVVHASAARVWIAARCGSVEVVEGDPEVRLRRDLLARDLGVKATVRRAVSGVECDEEVQFFEGFTAHRRTPSTRSEAGERTKLARERLKHVVLPPIEHPPIWHEAHPGRPDLPRIRICTHPVVKVTARFVYVQRTCPPWSRTSPPYGPVRLPREDLKHGVAAGVWVADKDARGYSYNTRAWFFEGAVPAEPYRPPAWHAFREQMRKLFERGEREAAARRSSGYRNSWWEEYQRQHAAPGSFFNVAGDVASLAALGLTSMPADEAALKAAWREAAKRTHPDAPGGNPEAFMRARTAYERLRAAFSQQNGAST